MANPRKLIGGALATLATGTAAHAYHMAQCPDDSHRPYIFLTAALLFAALAIHLVATALSSDEVACAKLSYTNELAFALYAGYALVVAYDQRDQPAHHLLWAFLIFAGLAFLHWALRACAAACKAKHTPPPTDDEPPQEEPEPGPDTTPPTDTEPQRVR